MMISNIGTEGNPEITCTAGLDELSEMVECSGLASKLHTRCFNRIQSTHKELHMSCFYDHKTSPFSPDNTLKWRNVV